MPNAPTIETPVPASPDAPTLEAPVPAEGLKSKALRPARIVLRKLLRPFMVRQSEVIGALVAGAHSGAIDQLRHSDKALRAKTDALNEKLDKLNDKLDRINTKFDEMVDKFDALEDRQSGVERDFAAVVALHWDHEAVARRLAQLEDRMIGLGAGGPTDPDADAPSIRFPGLDHYAPAPGPEAVES